MEIFMFVMNDEPHFRKTLAEAQAALEDYHIDEKGYAGVQWGDEGNDQYGAWLTFEYAMNPEDPDVKWSGQIIWPTEVDTALDRDVRLSPFDFCAAQMSLSVTTAEGKKQIMNAVSEADWNDLRLRPHLITGFAMKAGQSLADHWTREGR